MPDPYDKSNAIAKAASLARGDRLGPLYRVCEKQRTISTARLESMLDVLADDMKLDAIFLRELSKKLPE